MSRKSVEISAHEYKSIKASILDIPFIYEQMMNGCELGVFSDQYLKGTGGVNLFWFILRGVLTQRRSTKPMASGFDWYIISTQAEEIGFLHIKTFQATDGRAMRHIALFGVHPRYQSQGHGTAILKLFIAEQPAGTTVLVNCTKFAKAMQRVLKRLRFIRNPKAGYFLEEYCLVKA